MLCFNYLEIYTRFGTSGNWRAAWCLATLLFEVAKLTKSFACKQLNLLLLKLRMSLSTLILTLIKNVKDRHPALRHFDNEE